MLHIQKFLLEHSNDWKQLLEADPYCLTIREKDGVVLFMYNQIDSDFNIPLVQECRGIILEQNTWKPVCFPFTKFWNYGEGHAAVLDWSTACVYEKIDGSMIKLWWYKDKWNVSTMSMIDAGECTLMNNINPEYQTFLQLFEEGAKNCTLDYNSLDKNYTYMFELVSPYNRVVIPYKDIKVYHTGTRNNITLEELDVDIGIEKPKQYSFISQEDLLSMVQNMPFSEEGYVVVDANWNRVKIKSPAYVAIHHLHNNGDINKKRALELVMLNEHGEFLSYFPEYTDYFKKIEDAYNTYVEKIRNDIEDVTSRTFSTRKDYALYVKNLTNPGVHFCILDGKISKDDWQKYLLDINIDKMIEVLKL